MAKLPRYAKTGVELAPAPQFDYADLRESARVGQSITQAISRMSDFLYRQEAAEAEQRGKQVVATEGASPVLKRLAEGGGPKNIEERSAFQTANRIASIEVETQARQEINRIVSDAEINNTPFTQVDAQLQDVVDGFPAALSDLDPETAGILRGRLGSLATNAELRYSSYYNKYQLGQAQGKFVQTLSTDTNDIIMFAGAEHGTSEGVEEMIGMTAQKMRDLQIDETKISQWIVKTRTNAIKSGTVAEFQRLKTIEEKKEYLTDLEKSPLPALGVIGTRQLIKSLKSDLTNSETIAKKAATDAEKDIKTQITLLKKGGIPSDTTMLNLESTIGNLGFYGTEAKKKYEDLDYLRERATEFRRMSPMTLQNTINELSQGIEGKGSTGIDTELETETLKLAEGLLRTINTESQKDLYSLGVKMGLYDFNPIDMSSPEKLGESIMQRRQQVRVAAGVYGVPPMFLTNEEATVMTSTLMSRTADVATKLQLLNSLQQHFAEDSPEVFGQIAPKQPELAHIGGLVSLGLPSTAAEALEGMKIISEDYKIPEFTPTNTNFAFDDFVGSAFQIQKRARATTFAVAKAIYAKRAFDNSLTEFNAEIWTQSISAAIGQNGTRGGIETIRDQKTIIHPDLTKEDLEYILENITVKQFKELSGQDVNEELVKNINEEDHWYLTLINNGIYAIHRGVPGSLVFKKAGDKSGNPIIINALKFYNRED